ncbi:MAG: hypothetical protein A2X48_13050 [Lentisphaerae bacterium GWF2_49_21]|nr:MAG: hypothetical protein A2X48_13050 [Lentisphaerae bacterium GWF2_49_21]
MNKKERLKNLQQLRNNYSQVRNALPWFDCCIREKDHAVFSQADLSKSISTPPGIRLQKNLTGKIRDLYHEKGPFILIVNNPDILFEKAFLPVLKEIADQHIPVSVVMKECWFDKVLNAASNFQKINFIIESGEQKLIYHIEIIEKMLANKKNIFLSSFNFCNWLGIEKFCHKGLGKQLLFGSHFPRFSPDFSMAQIIMGELSWKQKCDVAGNNLRRLFGLDEQKAMEQSFSPTQPFIIDSHAHFVKSRELGILPFPTPDTRFTPRDWLGFLDHIAVDKIIFTPMASLYNADITSLSQFQRFAKNGNGRLFYYETFHPGKKESHLERIKKSLCNPYCAGIKIHPSFHETKANHQSFKPIYDLAKNLEKPILAHSWENSSHNPVQKFSLPTLFKDYVFRLGKVPFIFGHAGGRPSTIDDITAICNELPNAMVDIAGDYFDNGLLEELISRIGPEKILFGTDVDWFDPRCHIGMALGSKLDNLTLEKIFSGNAIKTFRFV